MTDPSASGPVLSADGLPLRRSLNRALRRQKLRAFLLIAPLLVFVLVTFLAPIGDMLFRSVENQIVSNTLPRTVVALSDWDLASDTRPDDAAYHALAHDLVIATELKTHTRLGTRLNYEASGMSSLFRSTGRDVEDFGEAVSKALNALDPAWGTPATWFDMLGDPAWKDAQASWAASGNRNGEPAFRLADTARDALPRTAELYASFAQITQEVNGRSLTRQDPWHLVADTLIEEIKATPTAAAAFAGDHARRLAAVAQADLPRADFVAAFGDSNDRWLTPEPWAVIALYAAPYTPGYFLNAIDLGKTPQGIAPRPVDEQVYIVLFLRTLWLSLTITALCLLLGYPVSWLLANLPARQANLLMILVLLPFWTSLLVRTSAWKVLLQRQGVINDILVWIGLISDDGRLVMINNQFGTVIAMTHILLPFMILPLYSVMKTIPPSYMRAAKSLGANDWSAFWRVYFPQSVPGIAAGSILVFILAIGYYITPELMGGARGVFISNRIAYHIGTSLNWGLAAALGTMLLVVVLVLYWVYDRFVGVKNVKFG
jgi:putative spermidine/putrescine transport system permease protein